MGFLRDAAWCGLFFAVPLLLAGPATAGPYGMAGCGGGSLIFGGDNSLPAQTLASTVNGTSSQTSAISSGTSNCKPTFKLIGKVAQEDFLHRNLVMLAKESARGDGAMLTAYAETFRCSATALPAFKAALKDGYGDIFGAPGTQAILEATYRQLKHNAVTVKACPDLY